MLRKFGLLMMAAKHILGAIKMFAVLSYFAEPINDVIDQSANCDITTNHRCHQKSQSDLCKQIRSKQGNCSKNGFGSFAVRLTKM